MFFQAAAAAKPCPSPEFQDWQSDSNACWTLEIFGRNCYLLRNVWHCWWTFACTIPLWRNDLKRETSLMILLTHTKMKTPAEVAIKSKDSPSFLQTLTSKTLAGHLERASDCSLGNEQGSLHKFKTLHPPKFGACLLIYKPSSNLHQSFEYLKWK